MAVYSVDLLRIVVQDYLVFYKVDEAAKQVKVYRVLHWKRNIPDILER